MERCIAAPGLLAAIIVGKYCDHLPLYRLMATRKITRRKRLISELAAIQQVQGENLSFHGSSDRERLARAFSQKSAELVALELAAYRRKYFPVE